MNLSLLPLAYAATSDGASMPHSADGIGSILLLVGFVVLFYFLLLRPQQKRMKEQKRLIEGLAVGDEVITAGGILGKINKISNDFLIITIAHGVDITVQKASVTSCLPKGTLKTIE